MQSNRQKKHDLFQWQLLESLSPNFVLNTVISNNLNYLSITVKWISTFPFKMSQHIKN